LFLTQLVFDLPNRKYISTVSAYLVKFRLMIIVVLE